MASIWLSTVGEHMPVPGASPRLMRTGMLARYLRSHGHDVVWWTSAFDHYAKRTFSAADRPLEWEGGTIRFLPGRPYARNISWQRLINHRQIAAAFRQEAGKHPRPDAILCSFPTIELSLEAVRYGRQRRVPVWLDVRDLWPDIFTLPLPLALRPLGRLALAPYRAMARSALRQADGIVAITPGYLEWALSLAGRSRRKEDLVAPITYERPTIAPDRAAETRARLRGQGVEWDRPRLTFVGSLGRTYDLGPVLEAAGGLRESHPTAQIVIAGTGDREAEWRARSAGLSNVAFVGWADLASVSVLLEGSVAGLAAYSADAPQSIPNKIVEYLAFDLPVLSSLQGETADLLRETGAGITYQMTGPSLGMAIDRLLSDDRLRASMRAAATRTFGERFAPGVVHEALERQILGFGPGTK